MPSAVIFKRADVPAEFEQIHQLNYRVFAEEIGQHTADGSGSLVDPYHDRNVYFIALKEGRVLGMVAVNDQPPFSIEKRLPDVSVLDALGGRLLEVRLLALDRDHRGNQIVLAGILSYLYRYACAHGHSHLIASGITRQLSLYTRAGFQALGPPVQSGAAYFVPMAMALKHLPDELVRNVNWFFARQK